MVIGELITDFNVTLTGPIFDWFSDSLDSPEQWRAYYERREIWNMEHGLDRNSGHPALRSTRWYRVTS
jgi:hypothetical protein